MAKMVTVHLMQRQGFRTSKQEDFTYYEAGVQEMPFEHAQGMGLLDRIVTTAKAGPSATVAGQDPFDGLFDEQLTELLTGAGYKTLQELQDAPRDELMAVKGIGPAAFERIHNAIAMSKGDDN